MGRAVAIALALMAQSSEAYAYCDLSALLFGNRSQFGQHVDNEDFGDEFRSTATGTTCGRPWPEDASSTSGHP